MSYATCVISRNPFDLHQREVRHLAGPAPLYTLALSEQVPFIILRNGQAVLRRDWHETVRAGDVVNVVVLPAGGGGGSDPLRLLATIAVLYFAPQLAPELLSVVGASATAGNIALATAAITFAGMSLVNALLPPQGLPSSLRQANLAAPSPTYNLQAQGNLARLEEAIPEHFGRCIAFPDFAALPYLEYAGNEQYLYQLLCIGRGEYDIEAIRIEDTPITSFAEITYEVVQPGGSVTLFPSNVATSGEVSGQELPGRRAATYSQSGTTVTVTLTDHGLGTGRMVYLDFTSGSATDGEFTVASAPTSSTFTVTAASSLTTSGNVYVYTYIGPFVANASGTDANALGIDVVLPRGLYSVVGSSVESMSVTYEVSAQEIDDGGTPVGSWVVLGTETISDATTTPQRRSARYGLATHGRYRVRVRRIDVQQTASTYGHELWWGGLRAYLPETRNFGDVTLLAMRLRASNNLSAQASRKVNVICTRKLPVWNGSEWSAPQATTSIAWALAYVARQALDDARIDLAALLALDAVWRARGDKFNGRFDSAISLWEALSKIAMAGRAKVFMQGGVLRVVRDETQATPVALFSMRNIVRGSFGIEYMMPTAESADAVEVSYFDEEYWAPQRVLCQLDGYTADKPARVDLFGVTSRTQAFREGLYQAASNRYRRKLIRFATEMEGFIPSPGDLIVLQHDMVAWGQHAEATAVATVTNLRQWSQEFDNAAWDKWQVTVTSNATTAPDGSSTADLVVENTANNSHFIYATSAQNINVPLTFSVYLKAAGRTNVFVGMFMHEVNGSINASIDLTTGQWSVAPNAGGAASNAGGRIDKLPNGWYRVSVWGVPGVTAGSTVETRVQFEGHYAYTGDGVSGVYLWGAQLEQADAPGGYVVTTNAQRTTTVIITSESLTFTAGQTHYVGLRTKGGGVEGPLVATWAGEQAIAVDGVTGTVYAGDAYERTHITFGPGEAWRQPAKVVAIKPRGLAQVEIECVNEDPSVHTAENGETAPPIVTSQLTTLHTTPLIANLTCVSSPSDVTRALLTWTPAPGAERYEIEAANTFNPYSTDVSWTRLGDTTANNYSVTAIYGAATSFRVRGVGLAAGPWYGVQFGDTADYMWTNPSALMWDRDGDGDVDATDNSALFWD